MDFTQKQIDTARGRVKSGADFPKEIEEFKNFGITRYEFFIKNGECIYYGSDGFMITAPTEYTQYQIKNLEVNPKSSLEALKQIIAKHQQGKSDFPTFCKQVAEIGVNKWICDLVKMTCIYHDLSGKEMLIEKIPSVE